MNNLLKLDFFKSLSFPTKESGMDFIKQHPKLKKQIEEKIDEIDEVKYQLLEDIKNNIFSKYEKQKDLFLVLVKTKRIEKIAYKKDLKKQSLKQEMKNELLEEIKKEEFEKNKNKLKNKYAKAYPNIDDDLLNKITSIEELFIKVINKIEDADDLKIVEKQKIQVDKALDMLNKAINIMEKL